ARRQVAADIIKVDVAGEHAREDLAFFRRDMCFDAGPEPGHGLRRVAVPLLDPGDDLPGLVLLLAGAGRQLVADDRTHGLVEDIVLGPFVGGEGEAYSAGDLRLLRGLGLVVPVE